MRVLVDENIPARSSRRTKVSRSTVQCRTTAFSSCAFDSNRQKIHHSVMHVIELPGGGMAESACGCAGHHDEYVADGRRAEPGVDNSVSRIDEARFPRPRGRL